MQAQPIHADDQLIPLTRPHIPIISDAMSAITDFTEENGAARLIPGGRLRNDGRPTGPLRDHRRRDAKRAASWCGWEAFGTVAGRTEQIPGEWGSP